MYDFLCPLCQKPLFCSGKSYVCDGGHCYDIAKEGYVNLLLANRKNSSAPGDDREMVDARHSFLSRGYYEALLIELCEVCRELMPLDGGFMIDSGCGEGYYTLAAARTAAERKAVCAGIDISKYAVRLAAKRAPNVRFAVASAFSLPFADGCADMLINCFSPLCLSEFSRVLRSGGYFVYVVPSAGHLWQLKCALYDRPYKNEVKTEIYDGFEFRQRRRVRKEITIDSRQEIEELFKMTPYFWKTPREGRERLATLNRLTTQTGFDVLIYQKQ